MNQVGDAMALDITRGVVFRALVGKHNGARNLTTGIVTLAPGAVLPYHWHAVVESVTVLEGAIAVEVEGRRYAFGVLDNIVIPAGAAHRVTNCQAQAAATLHIAIASDELDRELVDDIFTARDMPRDMPEDSTGEAGAERVSFQRHATPYEANAGAQFQDFFNRDMGCEEMSGGYGLFVPGAQLPCHIHDFDESISIVQGSATCIVEGKRYSLSNNDTALVPRGRCHYFINDSDAPMAMIWVYAGPMPERMIMESSLCDIGFGEPKI